MDDEEIDRLIFDLRAMLLENGFQWALEQSDAAAFPDRGRRQTAHDLIDLAETVTVDLAASEIAALNGLGVEDLEFKLDEGGDLVDVDAAFRPTDDDSDARYRVRGEQRRTQLEQLTRYAPAFRELRSRVDGLL